MAKGTIIRTGNSFFDGGVTADRFTELKDVFLSVYLDSSGAFVVESYQN